MKEKIIKMALMLLKQELTEENINEINGFYDIAVKKVLEEVDFDFCKTYSDLILTGNVPKNPQYLYAYEYPENCIKIRNVIDEFGSEKPFEIAFEDGKKVVYSDDRPITAKYTTILNYEKKYDGSFVSLCAYCLAALSSYAITRNLQITNEITELYEQLIFAVGEKC